MPLNTGTTIGGYMQWNYLRNQGQGSQINQDFLDGIDSNQFLRRDVDSVHQKSLTVQENLTVNGNLYIQGDEIIVNQETMNVEDNIIILNSNFTTGSQNLESGIKIRRGDSDTQYLLYDDKTTQTFIKSKWHLKNLPSGDEGDTNTRTHDYQDLVLQDVLLLDHNQSNTENKWVKFEHSSTNPLTTDTTFTIDTNQEDRFLKLHQNMTVQDNDIILTTNNPSDLPQSMTIKMMVYQMIFG